MTNATKILRRVVMMVAAIIMTLITNSVFAGPIDWIERKWEEGKKGVEDTIEGGKDTIEGGKTFFDLKAHAEQFVENSSWKDLIGRSDEASWFIGFLFLGLVLITFANALRRAKKKGKDLTTGTFLALAFSRYLLAALVGFGYELFRSYNPSNELCQFALYFAYGLLGVGVLLHHKGIWAFLKAAKAREWSYFYAHEEEDEGGDDGEPEPSGPGTSEEELPSPTEASTPGVVPVPQPRPVPRPEPPRPKGPKCPECGKRTRLGANFCGHCKASLRQPDATPPKCPQCGKRTRPGANFCSRCKASFKAPAIGQSVPVKATREVVSPNDLCDHWWDTN